MKNTSNIRSNQVLGYTTGQLSSQNTHEDIQVSYAEKSKWWCVDYSQENLEPFTVKRIEGFLKHMSSEVIFGRGRVFLKVGERGSKIPFPLFQIKLTAFAKKYRLHPELWSFGRAPTLTEAWVQTQWRTLAAELLPAEAIFDYLNPLGLDKAAGKGRHSLRSLQVLGFQSLQDVLEAPEDVLLSRCKIWVDDIKSEYFPDVYDSRDSTLEHTTRNSFSSYAETTRSFQLEDWIPKEYLSVNDSDDDLRDFRKAG